MLSWSVLWYICFCIIIEWFQALNRICTCIYPHALYIVCEWFNGMCTDFRVSVSWLFHFPLNSWVIIHLTSIVSPIIRHIDSYAATVNTSLAISVHTSISISVISVENRTVSMSGRVYFSYLCLSDTACTEQTRSHCSQQRTGSFPFLSPAQCGIYLRFLVALMVSYYSCDPKPCHLLSTIS